MEAEGGSVLITGASTGIGRATALCLDRLGFTVFAGVRRPADGRALADEASPKLTPIHLDVTDETAIADVVSRVAAATSGRLEGLVNNAGLSLSGPLELTPLSDIRRLIDVNVIGLLAVTKAFLPLLRVGHGRIVNISSGHGLLAVPDKSVYAASKSAVQAISDALRLELEPFGVTVSCLAVGKVNTAVLGKIVADRERMVRDAPPEVLDLYSPLMEYFDTKVKDLPGISPDDVARVVATALRTDRPKAHDVVGPGARKMRNLAHIPTRLRDRLLLRAIHGGGRP